MLKVLEFVYYIIGFALADVVITLVQGNPINIVFSLLFSALFTLIFLMLMLFWKLITRKIKK